MLAGTLAALLLAWAPAPATPDRLAREAFARLLELRARLIAGTPAPPQFEEVASDLRLSRQTKDPRLAELFRRVADDQLYRSALSAEGGQQAFAPGLTAVQQTALDQLVIRAAVMQDRSDTAWMKAQLRRVGWFTIGRFGTAADKEAWLLVQHADLDPAFQERVLRRLRALLASNETRPSNYAYLLDRVALARHRPQRYGTQLTCTGAGLAAPEDVEAPDGLDIRRAAVGLGPVAEYEKMISDGCTRDERVAAPGA